MRRVTVKVIPNAKRDEVLEAREENGQLHMKIKVNAQPEGGKANEAVIRLLAEHFNLSKQHVEIERGHMGRTKLIRIDV